MWKWLIKPIDGSWVVLGLGLLAVFAGLTGLYILVIHPWMTYSDAKDWLATPCTIRSSEIYGPYGKRRSGGWYRPTIEYAYRSPQGQEVVSQQYDIKETESNNKAKIQAIVDAYPAGLKTTCYVNPRNPSQALLNRQWSVRISVIGFSMVFITTGSMLAWFAYQEKYPKTKTTSLDSVPNAAPSTTYPHTSLGVFPPPESNNPQTVQGTLLALPMLLFFVGISATGFVRQLFFTSPQEKSAGTLVFFGVLTVVTTAVLILAISGLIHLRRRNIQLVLSLGAHQLILMPKVLRVGQTTTLQWKLRNPRIYQRAQIQLIGSDRAVPMLKTMTPDPDRIHLDFPLVDATFPKDSASGEAKFEIPDNSMRSTELPNHHLKWLIRITTTDLTGRKRNDDYRLNVLPAKWPGLSSGTGSARN